MGRRWGWGGGGETRCEGGAVGGGGFVFVIYTHRTLLM